MSGYTDCACRDCFDVAIGGLCGLCEAAGCYEYTPDADTWPTMRHNFECQREDDEDAE